MAPVWKTASAEAHSDGEIANKVEWVQKECYGDNWAPGKDLDFCKAKGVDAFPTIIMNKNGTDLSWTPDISGTTVDDKAESLLDFVRAHATGNDVKISSLGAGSVVLATMAGSGTDCEKFVNFL
jgi:hypothetical protein